MELADRRGWIQAYDIPSETSHQEVTVNGPLEVPSMTGDQPGKAVFPVFYLPEFRNTHVLVDITFTEKDEVKVQVVPYAEVILEPEFGLKPETKN